MKVNRFATAMIFAITAAVFFACSDDNSSSNGNGTTDIDSQVYYYQCSDNTNSCSFETPYTGSGIVKATFMSEDYEDVLGIMDMGTVNNGKINLEFHIPEEEFQGKGMEIRLYSNTEFIGRLLPISANYSRDNGVVGIYAYFAENFQNKSTYDNSLDYDVIFVNDIDVKKGWNLIYEKDEYEDIGGKRVNIITKTNDAGILDGTELKWILSLLP